MTGWTCAECASEYDSGYQDAGCAVCGASYTPAVLVSGRVGVTGAAPIRAAAPVRATAASVASAGSAPAAVRAAVSTAAPAAPVVPIQRVTEPNPAEPASAEPQPAEPQPAEPQPAEPDPGWTGTSSTGRHREDSDPVGAVVGGPPAGAVFASSAYRTPRHARWTWLAAGLLLVATGLGVYAVKLADRPRPAPQPTADAAGVPTGSGGAATTSATDPVTGDTPDADGAGPVSVGMVTVAPEAAADPAAGPVAAALDTYFTAVNSHDVGRILSVWEWAGADDPGHVRAFAYAVSTTADRDVTLLSVGPDSSGGGSEEAEATFTSTQEPGFGPRGNPDETCTDWDVTYTLSTAADGTYRIVGSTATHRAC